ncbi:EF-hand and coiled-coil domain-containing protein 1 [Athene cunicularia]|uniref:EF-hand and coiled-coil domain-containing protein 1 n=1 Tax=Athene cunicularia TaxID=194338 RepID=UPI000EF674B1|nr:EF-hand and coiled-coil domain-containing protein 1 [Athene cunicularia]
MATAAAWGTTEGSQLARGHQTCRGARTRDWLIPKPPQLLRCQELPHLCHLQRLPRGTPRAAAQALPRLSLTSPSPCPCLAAPQSPPGTGQSAQRLVAATAASWPPSRCCPELLPAGFSHQGSGLYRAALKQNKPQSTEMFQKLVGLRKSRNNHKEEGTCFIGSKRPLTQNHSQTQCLQSVLKEVELIRSSRDGQIEEAIKFNQELERELKSSQEALVNLEDCNRNLKREQAEMRKKVEEARHAVLTSLGKVKELEVKANEVPHLQIYIQQLESELQHYRSETVRFQLPSGSSPGQKEGAALPDGRYCLSAVQQDRRSPTGGAGISENEDQLFRSVEGQAASDEEEEKWAGDQPTQVDHRTTTLAKLPCCGSGCDEKMRKKLMSCLDTTNTDGYEAAPAELTERITQLTEQLEFKGHEVKKTETNMEEMKGPLLGELQQKAEETELLKMELQMLETERVRLSLVEEKLMDVLQLLQQLRDLNISKRALGKILLSTLESCRDPQPGKAHLFEVLDTLYHELTTCELLESQPLEKAQSRQALSNPLVISC